MFVVENEYDHVQETKTAFCRVRIVKELCSLVLRCECGCQLKQRKASNSGNISRLGENAEFNIEANPQLFLDIDQQV